VDRSHGTFSGVPASTILSFAFGYGRVYCRTREGLSYSSGVLLRVAEERASLSGMGSCRGEVTGRLIRTMLEEVDRIHREPITPEELETARVFQLGGMVRAGETPRAIVDRKLDQVIRDRPDDYDSWQFRGLQNATPSDLIGLAQRYLRFDDSTVVLVLETREPSTTRSTASASGRS
jgi:predicted Zn-dependent peptidase